MDIKFIAAVIAAKISKLICKLLKYYGTSLPGKVALKIDPRVLNKLSKGKFVIMVTGTNGKTTTTRMISEILESAGIKHLINRSGANLAEGIVSIFIDSVNLAGRSTTGFALLEVDEATVNKLKDSLQPDVLVVTNFFRDQLDRYGELYSVVDKVKSALQKFPKAKLILNADDSLCASLAVNSGNETIFFGVESGATLPVPGQNITAVSYCGFCKAKYDYSYKVLGHLGGYECPGCGFKRPDTQIKCTKVTNLQSAFSAAEVEIFNEAHTLKIGVPGLYNIYNALAAIGCSQALQIPVKNAVGALARFQSCFGRMEVIHAPENKQMMLMLAKNPVGFNQILNYLSTEKKGLNVAFVINDQGQDGRDVSWLWDVDFEKAAGYPNEKIYASGLRAEDMALRLKYAGIPEEQIRLNKDYRSLIDMGLAAVAEGETFYIVATYTAMMDVRKILKNRYGLKEIWQ